MTLVKFGKLLNNAGVRMSTADTAICFNYFDVYQKGVISPEEYAAMLSLTDFELDLAVEKVRLKLISAVLPTNNGPKLKATISKRTSGVIHAGSLEVGINTGKYKIRQNLMLIEIFRIVDNQKNGIISVDELMDLSSKLEVFLTEEEARRFLVQMDISRNDRVEEFDFIYSMNSDNDCIPRKASRVRDSAAALRRWLVRGSSDTSVGPGGATASNQQWHDFKINYERVTKMKFPGFLSSQLMSLTTARLGIRLSAMEARELTLLIAPEKNGRIFQSDLHAFMTSSCRTIGELIALVEKDIFSDLLDAYRAHREALEAEGKEDIDLSDFYRKKLLEFQSEIENVYAKQKAAEAEAKESDGNGDTDGVKSGYKPEKARPQFRSSGHEIIALSHLKAGIEEYIL